MDSLLDSLHRSHPDSRQCSRLCSQYRDRVDSRRVSPLRVRVPSLRRDLPRNLVYNRLVNPQGNLVCNRQDSPRHSR